MRMLAPLLVLSVLGGCATTGGPVSVTRFSAAADVARGSVAPAPGGAPTLEARNYEDAVARELDRVGFASADPASARYFYTVDVTRDRRLGAPRRSPVTIGIGGGTGFGGGYHSGGGIGLGASFGLGGNRSSDTPVTRLSVQLRDRATGRVAWEGRAEGQTDDVARVAAALFRDFPGESGRTISVP